MKMLEKKHPPANNKHRKLEQYSSGVGLTFSNTVFLHIKNPAQTSTVLPLPRSPYVFPTNLLTQKVYDPLPYQLC